MYKGDGSYNTQGIEKENCLLSLLQEEYDAVGVYNNSIKALNVMKSASCNYREYQDDLVKSKERIQKVREQIRDYLDNKLDIVVCCDIEMVDFGEEE